MARYDRSSPTVSWADPSEHAFGPHTHDAFAIRVVVSGAQRFHCRGSHDVADRSALMLTNPDELHTASAASAERWRYRLVHIEPANLRELLGEGAASPWFADALVHAPLQHDTEPLSTASSSKPRCVEDAKLMPHGPI